MDNIILDTDSYKASHYLQYPPGTTSMFSYFESRGGKYPGVLFFGLQYYLKKYLTQRITMEMVDEAKEFFGAHGEPFPYGGWMYIARNLEGKLPLRIRAVPEGTYVPNHNVLMTVESTDPRVFWLVTWLETVLVRTWYPSTVATRSRFIKNLIYDFLVDTADEPDTDISFKLHDFGSRGVSSQESAQIGGAAHLINFMGSDTVAGVWTANRYYNNNDMSGFSIPAAEHSTITAWGKDGEIDAYRNMLEQFAKSNSLVAVVSDSYDLWNAVNNYWGLELKQQVVDSGATVVIRPDSGDPPTVVRDVLLLLDEKFGSTTNKKGYKVLNNVRVIQGDGINENSIREILSVAKLTGFSATNINFGMGGGLLQQLDRDTQKFAFKCSHVIIDGQHKEVFKDPVTDAGKASKAGRLDLVKNEAGLFETRKLRWGLDSFGGSKMVKVFENGELITDHSLYKIRARAEETAKNMLVKTQ